MGRLLGQARLLTLAGPGGVGKSRLALRAAAEAAVGIPDGVYLAELSGLKGPNCCRVWSPRRWACRPRPARRGSTRSSSTWPTANC
ncbi:hypothetical protein NKH77_41965 [Streptomyces sp. M19]